MTDYGICGECGDTLVSGENETYGLVGAACPTCDEPKDFDD